VNDAVVLRVVFATLLLLGVVTAWCSQLGDTAHRFAIHEISQVVDKDKEKPNAENARLYEARQALEASVWIWNVTLFVGIGTVVVAGIGWSLTKKRPPGSGMAA
jgi:hypothetical protein